MVEEMQMMNTETVEAVAQAATEAVTTVAEKAKGVTIPTPAAAALGATALVGAFGIGYTVVKHGITFIKGGLKALRCKKKGALAECDEPAKVDGEPVETDVVETPAPEAKEESKA